MNRGMLWRRRWFVATHHLARSPLLRRTASVTANNTGHFGRFGLARDGYELDEARLKQRYQDLQRQNHPDLVAAAAAASKTAPGVAVQAAEEESALINEGYAVLSDPLRRAEYLLALHCQPIEEDDGLSTSGGGTGADMGLLMEVMEWREEIEDVQSEVSGRDSGAEARLDALVAQFRDRQADSIAGVADAWRRHGSAAGCEEAEAAALRAARTATIRLKYVRRAVEELQGLLPAA